MQREIKFRAWNKKEHRYSSPFTFQSLLGDIAWYDVCEVWLQYGDGAGDYWVLYSPYFDDEEWELQQCTGLHDKRGTEAYQDDFVRLWNDERLYQVVWNADCARFDLKQVAGSRWPAEPLLISTGEIVGNKWEHPNLLEGRE